MLVMLNGKMTNEEILSKLEGGHYNYVYRIDVVFLKRARKADFGHSLCHLQYQNTTATEADCTYICIFMGNLLCFYCLICCYFSVMDPFNMS
jgi:hypothetical protein